MDLPITTVAVFERNRTRTDLYSHWLDAYDVRSALTTSQAEDILDRTTAVAVVDQEFTDGETSKLLELIESRAPACRIVATRPRSSTFPDLDVENQLVKPVFEENLVDTVETLFCRANFHLALTLYYRTIVELAPLEFNETDEQRYTELQGRADRLRGLIFGFRRRMTDEDVAAVVESMTVPDEIENAGSTEQVDSKYQPDKCSKCGVEWTGSSESGPTVIRLAAHVWRCAECGHVQMHTDAGNRRVNPS